MVRASAAELLLSQLHTAQNAMYAGGDDEPVCALLTDDVVWSVPGANALAGSYQGIEQVIGYFHDRRRMAGETLRLHPGELLVGSGDHVAALTDGSATIGGTEHRWSTVGLYRLHDRRIAACWLLPLDQAAFDRAWSAPAVEADHEHLPVSLDHVQIAAPAGCEDAARRFYGALLGLSEIAKPPSLQRRGGVWFSLGAQQLHIGVEDAFVAARKAHPAIRVSPGQLDDLERRLTAAGAAVIWDDALPATRRFYTADPWGNRVEIVADRPGFSVDAMRSRTASGGATDEPRPSLPGAALQGRSSSEAARSRPNHGR
jgi:catechol 2,3-dioxygenase-like lactoylglutathione lyase family enzyme/ketosteroid isomerase-like protein